MIVGFLINYGDCDRKVKVQKAFCGKCKLGSSPFECSLRYGVALRGPVHPKKWAKGCGIPEALGAGSLEAALEISARLRAQCATACYPESKPLSFLHEGVNINPSKFASRYFEHSSMMPVFQIVGISTILMDLRVFAVCRERPPVHRNEFRLNP